MTANSAGKREPLVILKSGVAEPEIVARFGDFEDWIKTALGEVDRPVAIVDCDKILGGFARIDIVGLIITGANEMVTDNAPWLEPAREWIRSLHSNGVPILGICFGHQLLAQALGGVVGYNPAGKEQGTAMIRCTEEGRTDVLFAALGEEFPVQESHWQSVFQMPPGAVRLASNQMDINQAFRVGNTSWGVQFHPEFTTQMVREYVTIQAAEIRGRGEDPDEIRSRISSSPAGAVLSAFSKVVFERNRCG